MEDFRDKVVLITGAGRGIGQEIAVAFSSLGAKVAANDINPVNLDETLARIEQKGGYARAYIFDVAKRMPIEAMIAEILDHFGRIDILVNHASVRPEAALLDMDEWGFHRTLDVNLGGAFFTMQQVGRAMRQQGGGVMVNIVSANGNTGMLKGSTAFTASQAGLIGLTQAAAQELAPFNIHLNAICCGPISKNSWLQSAFDFSIYQSCSASNALSLPDELSDTARLTLFLCSEAAFNLTGQIACIADQ